MNLKGVKISLETQGLKPNFSELGRNYDIDRRTAKKRYYGIENKIKHAKSSKLDKHIELLKEKFNIPGINIKSVYEYIKMNIDADIGTYSNFKKYVRRNNEIITIKDNAAHVMFETPYGEQLQFDWKGPITLHTKGGEEIIFYIFGTTLGASRFHTFIYSSFMTLECVQECLIRTFNIIGGVPKNCLTDNMSSIVNHATQDFTKEFKMFSKDMGFKPKRCKKYHPYTKGKVESSNRFMKWLYPYDYEFEDEEELKKIIEKVTKQVNLEINQTTNMPPVSLFIKEKEYLQPIPDQTILDEYLNAFVAAKVSNTMLVHYKGCKYSVPKKYINQTVKLKEVSDKLFIYYNKKLIVTHDISRKKINYRKEDYYEGLSSSINNKTHEEIESLAIQNLELLGKL